MSPLRTWLARIVFLTALAFAPAGFAAGPSPPAAHQVLVLLRLPPEHVRAEGNYAGGYGDRLGQAARRRVAEELARKFGLALITSWPMPLIEADCFVLQAPADKAPEAIAAQLARDPRVLGAEPMHAYRAQGAVATHNDPLYLMQPAAAQWRLAQLHALASGRGVTVAVVDSKIDAAHPDLAGQVALSRDFVTGHPSGAEQHGTGVAGVIAAVADNRVGIAGIAPRARLMALRACWQEPDVQGTVCDTLSLAKALHFAIDNRAQVINLSLSGPPDLILGSLLDAALGRGVTVVAAAAPDARDGGFPASHAGVVAVTDGAQIAGVYLAPGRDVPTSAPGGRWSLVNGSSYAAAHVSGLFALLRERDARATSGAALVASGGRQGAIDACASLAAAAAVCACDCGSTAAHQAGARP